MQAIATAVLTLFVSSTLSAQAPATAPPTPDTDLTKLGYVSAGDIAAGLKRLPTQKLGKGDFFVVPPGLPHMFANIAPSGLQLMQMYLPKTR